MEEQRLVDLLIQNIAFQLRHPNYERTIEIRNFSKMIVTDEGQGKEVTRARRFEDDGLKDQRQRLYNSFTGAIISSLRKNWKRLQRIEGVRKRFVTQNEEALSGLHNAFYNFMPGESLDDWLARITEHINAVDPNRWIVFERWDKKNEDGAITSTQVWPFIVDCVNALNFEYQYGELQWFLCRTIEIEASTSGGVRKDVQLENYFLYAPGRIVRAREVGEKTVQEEGEKIVTIDIYPAISKDNEPEAQGAPMVYGGKKTRNFYLKVIYNGTTEVPAMVVGAYVDEATGHQTRVPWFWPAKGLLLDVIRLKSALDVNLVVNTYPRRWEFVKPCRFSSPEAGECTGGYLNGIRNFDHICPACHGSGKSANFTTEQEVLQLILPEEAGGDGLLELSKLAFTEPVDTAFPELLQRLLDLRAEQIVQAIFSNDSTRKPDASGMMTAFEVARINEGVHDALVTYGKRYSQLYELAYRVGAQYMEFDLSVDHSFPEDLQIELLDELLDRFRRAKDSGVGHDVLRAIRGRVQQKVYEGDPDERARIEARYRWLPFDDQTPESVAMIISSRHPTDPDVVLYQNFAAIFRDIEQEQPMFYRMSSERQRQIVKEKVDQYTARIILFDAAIDAAPDAKNDVDAEPGVPAV